MKSLLLAGITVTAVISLSIGFCTYSQAKPEAQPAPSSSGSVFAKYENERLSVDIKDVGLEDVLRKVAEQTGISFSLPPSLCTHRLMVRFANFDIDDGINKLLGSFDRIFIYDRDGNATAKSGTGLREVRIYIKEDSKAGASGKPVIISGLRSDQSPADTNKAEAMQARTSPPKQGSDKSLKEWSKDLQDGDEAAKLSAVQALARMGGHNALGPLTSALEDPNPEVSRAAENALPDIYASLEEENSTPGSDPQQQTIEGAPSFAIDSTGVIEGGQMDVDVRLSDVPEKLITSGFMLSYDPSQMEIVGVDVYDGSSLNGPWDDEMTNKVANPAGESGKYMVIVGNLGSVSPDENGNINLARVRVNCTGNCDGQITLTPVPNFDTSVGNSSTIYDNKMPPSQFRLN